MLQDDAAASINMVKGGTWPLQVLVLVAFIASAHSSDASGQGTDECTLAGIHNNNQNNDNNNNYNYNYNYNYWLDTLVVPEEAATTAGAIRNTYNSLQEGAEKHTWPDSVTSGIIGATLILWLVYRCKQLQRVAKRERAATRLQARARGRATQKWFMWQLILRVAVQEKARAAEAKAQAEAANTIRFYYCFWRARRVVVVQRVWRGCRVRARYNALKRGAGAHLSALKVCSVLHLGDGSFQDLSCCWRDPNGTNRDDIADRIEDQWRRMGISRLLRRLLLRLKKSPNAKMQASRKAAAEARWAVMERDRKNKTTDGYYETVRGVRYLVPYSLEQGDTIRRLAKLAYGGIPDFLGSGRPVSAGLDDDLGDDWYSSDEAGSEGDFGF